MVVFAKGAWYALDSLCDLGYQVVGLDWLQDPADAVKIRGNRPVVLQGNADPGLQSQVAELLSPDTPVSFRAPICIGHLLIRIRQKQL